MKLVLRKREPVWVDRLTMALRLVNTAMAALIVTLLLFCVVVG